MKIDNNFKSTAPNTIPEDSSRASKHPAAASPAAPVSTNVHLSSESAHLRSIEKGFADTPVVDAARVNEIKQAISDGHFKIDANKIADNLIKTAQDLIRAHKA